MPRTNKFVPTVGLLIFTMISAVTCGIYTRMVKEQAYGLKQPIIDTASAVANAVEYRHSAAAGPISTLNSMEEQLLVGLRTAYTDSASPPYLYNVGPYLTSSDKCIQVRESEKNYCADIMQVVKHRHIKDTGLISFDGKTFVYYLHPITHNRSLIFLLGLERFSLLSKPLAMDSESPMFSLFKNGKSVTGDEYNAKNAVFTVSETMRHFSYLPARLYILAYRKDVHFQVCTLIIFLATLVAVISGVSYLYPVRRVINRGIVEKEAIINNHFEHVLGGEPFLSTADVKKLYSMYNSAFLDDLTKATSRRSFDENLKVLLERGGYLCLFDANKFKNINDAFGHLLSDEVLMKVAKILKSQILADKGKVYHFGGDEFAMVYAGGTLEELLSILKEIVHFRVGSINLSTSISVVHSNEYTTVERLKMLTSERLYESKKNDRAQISRQ